MAQFTNITKPSNTLITTNSFTKSGNYYYGTLALTAASGYKFDANANKYWRWGGVSGRVFKTGTLSLDDTKLTFSVSTSDGVIDSDLSAAVYIDAVAIVASQPITAPITQNCTNCTTNAPSTISSDTTQFNVIATPSNGYQFNTAPTLAFYDNNGDIVIDNNGNPAYYQFTVLASKLSANVTIDATTIDFNNVETVVITATAAAIPQYAEITVNTSLNNATISGIPQTVYENTVLQLTATANTDHEFQNAPYIYGLDANGNPITITFTVAQNKLTATVTADLSQYDLDENTVLTVYATAAAVVPYVDKYGTINLYKVTTNDLAAFAAQRFFKEKLNPSDTSGYFQLIDLGDFVVSVKRFYCAVTDVITDVLKCGNYNTNIAVNTPQNDNLTINCGTVAIPMHNNSNVDFDSEIKCFVPFVGYVSIPSDYCGKTIGLQYIVNLVNGDCVAKLTCNGIDIDFVQCSISNDIIYKTNKENNFVGNAEFNLQVLKGLQPFISVKYYTDANAQIYNADCVRVSLNSVIGYAQITELTNFAAANITETEKNTLIASLANGVIFENSSS